MDDNLLVIDRIYQLSLKDGIFKFDYIPIESLISKLDIPHQQIGAILNYYEEKQILVGHKVAQGPICFLAVKLTALGLDYHKNHMADKIVNNLYTLPLPKNRNELDTLLDKLYNNRQTLVEGSREYTLCNNRIEQIKERKNNRLKTREIILIIISIISSIWAITDLILRVFLKI